MLPSSPPEVTSTIVDWIRPYVVTLFPESSLIKSKLPTTSFVAGDDPFLFNFIVEPFASALELKSVNTGFAEVELSILISDPG